MISINWGLREIFIPQSYLTLVSGTIYEMDVEQFRKDLKDLEDSDEGMAFPATHNRNAPVTLAGVTYAQTLEIINGYTVTFEDLGSHYTVRFVGANHNIADVTNYDAVNLVIGNSAGLIQVTTNTGSGLSTIEQDRLKRIWQALMLDPASPVVTTPSGITFDDVQIDLTGDPETSITGTRQP